MHACECACVCDLIHCVLICADLLATCGSTPLSPHSTKKSVLFQDPLLSYIVIGMKKQADYYCNGVDGLRILFKKEKETDRTNSCDRNSLIFFGHRKKTKPKSLF